MTKNKRPKEEFGGVNYAIPVRLLQPFKGQHVQLGVMFVWEKSPQNKRGIWGVNYALPVRLLEPLEGQDVQLGVMLVEEKSPQNKRGIWGINYALPVRLLEPLEGQDVQLGVMLVEEKSPQNKRGIWGVNYALPVRLLEPLQGQDEQLGVVLVGEGWEGDGGEAATLQPVHHGGVDGHRLLCCDVGAVLKHRVARSGCALSTRSHHPCTGWLTPSLLHKHTPLIFSLLGFCYNSRLLYYLITEIKYLAKHVPHQSREQHILHVLKLKKQLWKIHQI